MAGEFVAGSIVGKVDLDHAPAIKAMEAVKAEAAGMKKSVEASARASGDSLKSSMKEAVDSIEHEIGRRSTMGKLLRLGMEGGVVGMGLMELKDMSGKAAEIATEFREGKIEGMEMVDKIASSVPILGQAWEAGRNIREALTGAKAEIEAINQEAERTTKFYDSQIAALKVQREILQDVNAQIRQVSRATEMIGASPLQQLRIRLAQQSDESATKIAKELKSKIDEETNAAAQGIKIAKENAAAAFVKLQSSQAAFGGRDGVNESPVWREAKYGSELTIAQGDYAAKIRIVTRAETDLQQRILDIKAHYSELGDKDAAKGSKELRYAELRAAGVKTFSEVAKEMQSEIMKGAEAWKKFGDAAKQAAKESADALHRAGIELRQMGMSDAAKKLDDYEAMAGSDPGNVERMKKILRQQQDQRATEEYATPLEKFSTSMDKLIGDLKAGLIDKPAALLSEKGLVARLRAEMPSPEYQPTNQDVRRFGFPTVAPAMPEMADPLSAIAGILGESRDLQKKQSETLEKIADDHNQIQQWTPAAPF